MRWVVMLGIASGCVAGGGPVVGYGSRGWVGGAEVGVSSYGPISVGLASGFQTGEAFYLRLDGIYDASVARLDPGDSFAGSLGVGMGFSDGVHTVAAAKAGGGFLRDPVLCNQHSSHKGTAVELSVQLRYMRGWHVVLAPRYAVVLTGFCS